MSATSSRTGVALTAAAGVLGALPTLLGGIWIGALGVPIAVGGVYDRSRRLLGLGVVVLFGAVVVGSLTGVPLALLVAGMAGTALAWDLGENAISVAEQLGTESATRRGQLLHATVSAGVVAAFATGSVAVYGVSTGGFPLVAVTLLVVGALIVLVGLGR